MKHLTTLAVLTAAALAASPSLAASTPDYAKVVIMPTSSSPPVPAGLKITCMSSPNTLQSSKTCPVVVYQGVTTWAYSYVDNRVSLALVSYGANNAVIRNVEIKGTRYVWNAVSSLRTKTVLFVGQSNANVTQTYANLGPAK